MTDFTAMSDIGEHPEEQFRFLLKETAKGVRCALVTIVGVIDTASRNVGAHMIVCEDGRYAGSVSSGCIDGNIAAVAVDALQCAQYVGTLLV